jgi:hypothetical protein
MGSHSEWRPLHSFDGFGRTGDLDLAPPAGKQQ